MKALKAFIKPVEAPQRSVKIKNSVNFYLNKTWEKLCDSKLTCYIELNCEIFITQS